MINANENPLGPCQAALQAMAAAAPTGGRYDVRGETGALIKTVAAQHGLQEDCVAVYPGSSEPLAYAVMAFTSPERGLVMPNPTFDAAVGAAQTAGARVSTVPLTASFAHDVRGMIAKDPQAGVFYICNPNNPTGTLTPREELVWALDHKPKGSILLIDEAYLHFSDAPAMVDLVAAGRDLIVLRTFSKIYGMAGLRCGLALGRPDLLAPLRAYCLNPMSIMGSAAARASLLDPALVPARKTINSDIRKDVIAYVKSLNHTVLGDPQTNCFMIDTGRDGAAVIAALRRKNVYIGRTWPIWPTAVRVSVGSPEEMEAFKAAFRDVMAA
jgi:histidinol-phosphate aminotransferase